MPRRSTEVIHRVEDEPAGNRQVVNRLLRGALRRLAHLLAEAKRRSYRRLSLETGSGKAFEPARKLYVSFGFAYCEPFADYVEDPHSVFMTKQL